MSERTVMSQLTEFKILELKPTQNKPGHQIFIKEHTARQKSNEKPMGRTLFVLNIPPYINKENLTSVFKVVGLVENILFAENSSTEISKLVPTNYKYFPQKELFKFRVAFIVFKLPSSLEKALDLKQLPPLDYECKLHTGVAKWTLQYLEKIPTSDAVFQNEIDTYMAAFDEIEERKREIELNQSKPNDEGWITVGKKGIYSGFKQKESVITKIEERSRKNKELKNFYTFQIRESKMKDIIGLREKFEQDKKRIEALKKSRRFKPF